MCWRFLPDDMLMVFLGPPPPPAFRVNVFPRERPVPGELRIFFPNKNAIILRSLGKTLIQTDKVLSLVGAYSGAGHICIIGKLFGGLGQLVIKYDKQVS